ncbi:MAG: response regulator [Kofleriaceae bacterium]|nr:response regulator [Kofleriaceae bacterium]
MGDERVELSETGELLARLTARLASTARLDEIVDAVLDQIVDLGFGAVWMAALDEPTGNLVTLKEVIDGVDTTHEMPPIFMLDMRQPIGHGFRERRMINIADPASLHIFDHNDELVPPGKMALPRVIYDHMRGHPFACGPLLGSRGQPVGALGLSSYLGKQPIPDSVLSHGLLRAFMDHLGIAMERASNIARLERLNADLVRAQTTIANDARIKAVGELASAVAHDLNNLAGVALMAASIGRRSPQDAHEALPRIERANRAIGDLVSRLQRVSREGASDETVEDTAKLQEVVDDVLVLVSPILREESIVLDLEIPTGGVVCVDPVLLHRIVLNLVLNAQAALAEVPSSARRLRVRLREQTDEITLIIADTGPGIAPQVLPHLFQPFVTTKSGHAGLGLAAAHSALKHFGGHIEGRNASGGGAIFEVTLQRATRPEVAAAPSVEAVEQTSRAARILVVDDDPDIIVITRAFLEPYGYQVVSVLDSDQAIALAKTQHFDLVLCDVGMPKRSGLDVCEMLRGAGYRGRIVVMTGWETWRVKADRRAGNFDTLLAKPFVGADLLKVIDSVLGS